MTLSIRRKHFPLLGVVLLVFLLASSLSEAIPLDNFKNQVQQLREAMTVAKTRADVPDNNDRRKFSEISAITQVETPQGSVQVDLTWIDRISADLTTESQAPRRRLYWEALVETLEGLIRELELSFNPTLTELDIRNALRRSRSTTCPLVSRVSQNTPLPDGIPSEETDELMLEGEVGDVQEIVAMKTENGNQAEATPSPPSSGGTPGGSTGSNSSHHTPSNPANTPGTHPPTGTNPSVTSTPITNTSVPAPTANPQRPPQTQPTTPPPSSTPPPTPPPEPPPEPPKPTDYTTLLYWILGILVTLIVLVILFLIIRAWQKNALPKGGKTLIIGQDHLPEDPFQAETADLYHLAMRSAQEGKFEEAVRLMALGILLLLDQRGLLNYQEARTNGEYLVRLAVEKPIIQNLLASPLRLFDRLYYGSTPSSLKEFQEFKAAYEHLNQVPP